MARFSTIVVLLLVSGSVLAGRRHNSKKPKTTTAAPAAPPSSGGILSCSGKPDGFYPDPTSSCSSLFFACSGGEAHEMECAESTVFDEESGHCLEQDFVAACGGTPTTTSAPLPASDPITPPFIFDCSSKPDGDYANPSEPCSQLYVSCIGEQATYRMCGEDLKFDSTSNMCLETEWVAACGGTPTELPETTTVASDPSFDCAQQIDGFYAKDSCSAVFYACSGGFSRAMQCAEPTVFDESSQLCLERDWVLSCGGEATTLAPFVASDPVPPPFPFDCTGQMDGDLPNPIEKCSTLYVSCVGESPIYRQCVDGLMFDALSGECHESEWVQACGGQSTTRAPSTIRPSRIGLNKEHKKSRTTTLATEEPIIDMSEQILHLSFH